MFSLYVLSSHMKCLFNSRLGWWWPNAIRLSHTHHSTTRVESEELKENKKNWKKSWFISSLHMNSNANFNEAIAAAVNFCSLDSSFQFPKSFDLFEKIDFYPNSWDKSGKFLFLSSSTRIEFLKFNFHSKNFFFFFFHASLLSSFAIVFISFVAFMLARCIVRGIWQAQVSTKNWWFITSINIIEWLKCFAATRNSRKTFDFDRERTPRQEKTEKYVVRDQLRVLKYFWHLQQFSKVLSRMKVFFFCFFKADNFWRVSVALCEELCAWTFFCLVIPQVFSLNEFKSQKDFLK